MREKFSKMISDSIERNKKPNIPKLKISEDFNYLFESSSETEITDNQNFKIVLESSHSNQISLQNLLIENLEWKKKALELQQKIISMNQVPKPKEIVKFPCECSSKFLILENRMSLTTDLIDLYKEINEKLMISQDSVQVENQNLLKSVRRMKNELEKSNYKLEKIKLSMAQISDIKEFDDAEYLIVSMLKKITEHEKLSESLLNEALQKNHKLSSEIEKLKVEKKREYQTFNNENERLSKKIEEINLSKFQTLESLNEKIEELKNEKNEAIEKFQNLKKDNEELISSKRELTETYLQLYDNFAELNNEIEDLRAKNKEFDENSKLKIISSIEKTIRNIIEIKENLNYLSLDQIAKEFRIEILNSNKDNIEKTNQILGKNGILIFENKERAKNLRTILDLEKNQVSQITAAIESLFKNCINLSNTSTSLITKLKIAKSDIKSLKSEKKSLNDQISSLKSTLSEKITENTTLKSEISSKSQSLEFAKNIDSSRELKLKVLNEKLESSESQIKELTELNKNLTSQIKELSSSHSKSVKQIQNEKEEEYRRIEENSIKMMSAKEKEIKELESEINRVLKENERLSHLSEEIIKVNEQVTETKRLLASKGEELESFKLSTEKAKDFEDQEIQNLNSLLAKSSRENQYFKETMENITLELASVKDTLNETLATLDTVESEKRKLLVLNDNLMEKVNSHSSKKTIGVSEMNEKILNLQEEKKILQENYQKIIDELNGNFYGLKSEIEEKDNRISQLERELAK